jgi:hypothetical protein
MIAIREWKAHCVTSCALYCPNAVVVPKSIEEKNFHFMNTANKPHGAWTVMNSHLVKQPPSKHERLKPLI